MAVPLILVLAAPLFGLAQPGSTSRLDPKPPPKPPPGLPLNPYKTVHGGQTVGDPNPHSPDPLSNYVWDIDALDDPFQYQSYDDLPIAVTTDSPASFGGLASLTQPGGSATVSGAGTITFKFTQEAACWVEFVSADLAASGATVQLTISENSFQGEVHDLALHAHPGNIFRLEPNNQLYEGVRYIFLKTTAAYWTITGFKRTCQVVPTNYAGRFECSDSMLNRIWHTGAYTVKVTEVGNGLNSQHAGYLGSELKDRGDRIAFLGDAHAAQAVALVAFGNYALLNNSNQYTKNIGNSIQPYWVMWVDTVLDFYDFTGDLGTVRGLASWVEQRLDHADFVATSGTSTSLRWSRDDDRMGFGFESPDKPEARRAFLALLVGASRRYSVVAAKLGNGTAARVYSAMATKWEAQIKSAGPSWFKSWGMHASADAVIAGIVSNDEAAAMLAEGGAFSDPLALPSQSNFESYFILKALGMVGAADEAAYLVHRHWDSMIKLGATTTWERFDPQWFDSGCLDVDFPPVNAMNQDTSMAHPWAAGATAFLSKHGLGVAPTRPGFKTFDLMPLLLNNRSMTWIRGAVPTPHGPVTVDFSLVDGTAKVGVPAGTVAGRVGIPVLAGLDRVHIVHSNGSTELLWQNRSSGGVPSSVSAVPPSLAVDLTADQKFLCLVNLLPGSYEFGFEHAHRSAGPSLLGRWDPNSTAFNYTAPLAGPVDYKTGGAWVGKYGSKGHVLFNFSADGGRDVVSLPKFIDQVWVPTNVPATGGPPFPSGRKPCHGGSGFGGCVQVWANSTTDRNVLENPSGPAAARVAVGITSNRWASFHIDVQAADTTTAYNITLYMVDFTQAKIRQAIKAMDGNDRPIGPMALVEDFAGGAYVTYTRTTGGSMAFRILEVPSRAGTVNGLPPRPVVSGVFFD